MKRFVLTLAVLLAQFQTSAYADTALFNDLGGLERITKIANDAIDAALADPRILHTFDESDIPTVKEHLAQQICVLAGGPCTYEGKDMATVHKGLHLTNADFNALVEDLQVTMDRNDIPSATQNRLLALLAPMNRDVVTR